MNDELPIAGMFDERRRRQERLAVEAGEMRAICDLLAERLRDNHAEWIGKACSETRYQVRREMAERRLRFFQSEIFDGTGRHYVPDALKKTPLRNGG